MHGSYLGDANLVATDGYIAGGAGNCGIGRLATDQPCGAERNVRHCALAKRGGSSGAQESRCASAGGGDQLRTLAGARGQQSGVGICAPSRGTVRSEGSFLGSRICLRGCEKYTLLTMQAILNRHRLVWKGAKSERSLHGMGQVVFDRAGLGGIGAIQRFLQAHFCGFSARA